MPPRFRRGLISRHANTLSTRSRCTNNSQACALSRLSTGWLKSSGCHVVSRPSTRRENMLYWWCICYVVSLKGDIKMRGSRYRFTFPAWSLHSSPIVRMEVADSSARSNLSISSDTRSPKRQQLPARPSPVPAQLVKTPTPLKILEVGAVGLMRCTGFRHARRSARRGRDKQHAILFNLAHYWEEYDEALCACLKRVEFSFEMESAWEIEEIHGEKESATSPGRHVHVLCLDCRHTW